MDISESLTLLSVLIAMAMILPAAREQLRTDPAGFNKTLKLAGLYLLSVFIAIAITLWLISGPRPGVNVIFGMAFLLAWIFYGVLWLTRPVPRYRPLPVWIDKRLSALDYIFLTIILGGLGFGLWGRLL